MCECVCVCARVHTCMYTPECPILQLLLMPGHLGPACPISGFQAAFPNRGLGPLPSRLTWERLAVGQQPLCWSQAESDSRGKLFPH